MSVRPRPVYNERRLGMGEGAAWVLAFILNLVSIPIDILDSLVDPDLVAISSGCSILAALAMTRALWCRYHGR